MAEIVFSWNESKNRTNLAKHKVGFELAALVFRDPLRLTRQDRIEDGEERWQTIGVAHGVTLLLVAHTFVEDTAETGPVERVHIISARRATPRERKSYEAENG
jgi:hypothetical protein